VLAIRKNIRHFHKTWSGLTNTIPEFQILSNSVGLSILMTRHVSPQIATLLSCTPTSRRFRCRKVES